jgi:hypothetical protein
MGKGEGGSRAGLFKMFEGEREGQGRLKERDDRWAWPVSW